MFKYKKLGWHIGFNLFLLRSYFLFIPRRNIPLKHVTSDNQIIFPWDWRDQGSKALTLHVLDPCICSNPNSTAATHAKQSFTFSETAAIKVLGNFHLIMVLKCLFTDLAYTNQLFLLVNIIMLGLSVKCQG